MPQIKGKIEQARRRDVLKGLAVSGAVSMFGSKASGAAHTDDFTWQSVSRIREMIVNREVSALEVTEHFLARIDRLEPDLHAFLFVDHKGAVAAAKQIDDDLDNGKEPGALAGVPIAVKDQLLARGMPATAGSLLFANFRPSIDGTIVQRLRAAGAIIVGKTNMPEFASWPRTKSFVGGESLNPWDTTRIPGASSGGSSAAVAAGMIPAAIGTDGGGSTRIPASLCGLVGLFPTIGRVPDYGGFRFGYDGSAGPITKSVEDAALIQQVISGPDNRIPSGLKDAAPNVLSRLDDGIGGLRVAWSPDYAHMIVDAQVIAASHAALAAMTNAGAMVEEIRDRIEHPWGDGAFLADLQDAVAAGDYQMLPQGELPDASDVQAWLTANSEGSSKAAYELPAFRERYAAHTGLLTPSQRLASKFPPSMEGRPSVAGLRNKMNSIFAKYDVLCSPTMTVVAPVAKPGWATPYEDPYMGTNMTFVANSTRCPAVTVPCGFVRDLPVGFQIIGHPGDEPTVLRVARAIEKALPTMPRPPLAVF